MGGILLAVLVTVPLLITPNILLYFDVTPKVVCLLLGAAAAALWLGARGGLSRLMSFRTGRWLVVLLAAQALSLAASTAVSGNRWLSVSGTNWRRFGVITSFAALVFTLAVSAYVVERPGALRGIRRTIAVSGILAALYGILQYLGWDALLPGQAYHAGEGAAAMVRPPSTLGYANYYAAYLLFAAFAGLWTAMEEKSRAWRMAGLAAFVTATAGIVLSGTRAAALGLAAGALVFVFVNRAGLPMRRFALALGVLVVGLVGLYLSPWGTLLRGRVRWSAEEPLGGARLLLWKDSLRMAASRPVLGYGPETFSADFPRFQSPALARQFPDFYHESPHNMFLDALVSQGLVGLAVLLGIYALGGYAAYRARQHSPLAAAALLAALTAVCVSQQFTVLVVSTGLFFFLVIALSVAIEAPPAIPLPRQHRWLGLACGLPVAAALLLCALMYLLSDYALARCSRALDAGKLDQAVNQYRRAEIWQLPGAASDLWYSRRLARTARSSNNPAVRLIAWQQAVEAATRAVRTAEDPQNAWYNLAAFHAAQNDVTGTVSCLRSAILVAPNWFKPHWMLARTFLAVGRLGDAEREATLAEDLNAGKNPEVALTFNEIRRLAARQ
jgi:O-antigen ligase